MTYACAGHLPPLLHEPGAAPELSVGGRSAPFGSRAGRTVRIEQPVALSPGTRLLLYTDGLIERRDRTHRRRVRDARPGVRPPPGRTAVRA